MNFLFNNIETDRDIFILLLTISLFVVAIIIYIHGAHRLKVGKSGILFEKLHFVDKKRRMDNYILSVILSVIIIGIAIVMNIREFL